MTSTSALWPVWMWGLYSQSMHTATVSTRTHTLVCSVSTHTHTLVCWQSHNIQPLRICTEGLHLGAFLLRHINKNTISIDNLIDYAWALRKARGYNIRRANFNASMWGRKVVRWRGILSDDDNSERVNQKLWSKANEENTSLLQRQLSGWPKPSLLGGLHNYVLALVPNFLEYLLELNPISLSYCVPTTLKSFHTLNHILDYICGY